MGFMGARIDCASARVLTDLLVDFAKGLAKWPAKGRKMAVTEKIKIAIASLLLLALTPGYGRTQATVRLPHSVSPAAAQIPNAVAAPDTMPMQITVVLALRNTAELEQLKRDQQDPSSPSYHKWLTTAEFNTRFGPRQADADAVAQWLTGSGFSVKSIDLERRTVQASANAAVVESALDTAIVSNGTHYANQNEPAVPAALAPVIGSIHGLSNTFAVKPMLVPGLRSGAALPTTEEADTSAAPDYSYGGNYAFAPADLATYYNQTGLTSLKIKGTKAPDCIALAGVSNVHNGTFAAFHRRFHVPGVKLTKVFASGFNPGYRGDNEIESDLDVEYSHAVAPRTPIRLYIGGGANDLLDAISAAVSENKCGAISISYAYCGEPSGFYSSTLHPIFSQAAAQGQSVFVSSGDEGAAGIMSGIGGCIPGNTQSVSEMCADPNVTCVGGTQFDPNYDSKARNTSRVTDTNDSPAAWNEAGIGATGGGISSIFAIPSWQSGAGIGGTMRVVPDVSLGAAVYYPGYFVVAFVNGKNQVKVYGGTSLSSPAWAGYSRLIAQVYGGSPMGRLGTMNPRLYDIGYSLGSDSGLIDITAGNNDFNGVTGYPAGVGYDMATGWGSPDMTAMLIAYLAGGNATVTPANVSAPPKTQIADAGVLTLMNTSTFPLSIDSITLDVSKPAIFKSVSMSAGGQTVTPRKRKKMVFKFKPPIMISSGNMADFTLGATMRRRAKQGTPLSAQNIAAFGISANAAGANVTIQGLPTSLGTVTLTH
jgi:subtilase family serine protease